MSQQVKSKATKQAELRVLDKQIEDRKRYLREQESLITDLVETGNTNMMALNHEILEATKELKELKTDIRLAKRDKRQITEELDEVRKEATKVGLAPAFA